jgi:phage terminase large subunit-like protein
MRDINEGREAELPNDLSRILIAVDPAVSSEAHSDEHGIVAVASSQSGHGYMLEDGTTKGAPDAGRGGPSLCTTDMMLTGS